VSFSIRDRVGLLQSVVFRVERRYVEGHGQHFDRDVVVHPGAVVILPVDDLGRVGLLRQWRATVNQMNWELPAGTCDVAAEAGLATAKRELLEELGVVSDDWTLLRTMQNSPGWTDQITTLFRADHVRHVGASPQGPEETFSEQHWFTAEQVRELLAQPVALDSTLVYALTVFLEGAH